MIKTHINTLQRMIAYFLLISQLLTSCKPLEVTEADNTAEEKEIEYEIIGKILEIDSGQAWIPVEEHYVESGIDSWLLLHLSLKEKMLIEQSASAAIAKEILGDKNYLALAAWKKLGLKDSEAEAIEIPVLSDKMLVEIKWLQKNEQQPILFLDLGKSIEEIERLCKEKGINVLSSNPEKLRAESYYKTTGTDCPRWLLLLGSDHGVLPGSRNKNYDDQVKHMEANYPGYEVGGARELVTLVMLKYFQDGTVFFPGSSNCYTYGRCKEQYQKGDWEGGRLCLGYVEASSSSGFGGLVVSTTLGPTPAVGLFSSLVS